MKPSIEIDVLQEMLSVLAKILAKGLSGEQRVAVLRGYNLGLTNSQFGDEYKVFHALQQLHGESNSLDYIQDILGRIEGTRSFYQNVGPELDRLRYLTSKNASAKVPEAHVPYVFAMLPFKPEFLAVFESSIRPCLEELGCRVEHALDLATVDSIVEAIFAQISKADFLVADTTGSNPNVFYEIGYAHALGKKVLLLTQDTTKIPFDIGGVKHIRYKPDSLNALGRDLRRHAVVLCEQLRIRGLH